MGYEYVCIHRIHELNIESSLSIFMPSFLGLQLHVSSNLIRFDFRALKICNS